MFSIVHTFYWIIVFLCVNACRKFLYIIDNTAFLKILCLWRTVLFSSVGKTIVSKVTTEKKILLYSQGKHHIYGICESQSWNKCWSEDKAACHRATYFPLMLPSWQEPFIFFGLCPIHLPYGRFLFVQHPCGVTFLLSSVIIITRQNIIRFV